jgi:hypothetical protein
MSHGMNGSDRVELVLPATPEWLALARTTGAAIASRWRFTYDEIADLRLAIDELCLTLIRPAQGPGEAPRLKLVYTLDGSSMVVRGHVEKQRAVADDQTTPGGAGSMTAGNAADLSERILDALVDEHGSQRTESELTAWLRKGRSVAAT